MEDKVKELLKPRYKVIAPYPKAYHSIGKVLRPFEEKIFDQWWFDFDGERLQQSVLNNYPHLFRELQWWEERKEGEIPQHVSNIGKTHYGMIHMVSFRTGEFVLMQGEDITTAHLSNYLPATLEEYSNYINSKK